MNYAVDPAPTYVTYLPLVGAGRPHSLSSHVSCRILRDQSARMHLLMYPELRTSTHALFLLLADSGTFFW